MELPDLKHEERLDIESMVLNELRTKGYLIVLRSTRDPLIGVSEFLPVSLKYYKQKGHPRVEHFSSYSRAAKRASELIYNELSDADWSECESPNDLVDT